MEENKKVIESLQEENIQEELSLSEKKELTEPISEEEFKKQIHEAALANHQQVIADFQRGILHLRDYSGVKKFKSIRRAIRRGHVSIYGDVYPKRPFNNKKRGPGSITYKKRRLYEQFTHKNRAVC